MSPEARQHRLLIQEMGEELVVYDQDRHRVHRLNRTAALVWRSCDGEQTAADLARLLQAELGPGVTEEVVWQALGRLGKAHLLEGPVTRPDTAGVSRRQALRRLARTAALVALVPVVATMLAPSPLQAGPEPICTAPFCRDRCQNECRRNRDCPRSTPICRVLSCRHRRCGECTQRRCVKNASPT